MTEETANKEEVKESKLSEEDTQKIVNAVASDIVKTTNLFQAFELVKEKAFNWALDHVSNQMPEEEKLEIQKYENLDKARTMVMNSSSAEVKSMAVWFLGTQYLSKTPEKLKITLRHACENSEKMALKIIDFANDKNNDEKLITVIAIEKGIIKIDNGKRVVWADSEEPIFIGSQANDLIKDFSTWLKTDEEGRQNLKLIADKLPKKN